MRIGVRAAMAAICCSAVLAVSGPRSPSLAAPGFPAIPPGPITIGVSASLSGSLATFGQSTVASFNVALRAFDAQNPHGIDGHQLQMKVVNDQSTVPGAVAAAHQLVADRVASIVSMASNSGGVADQLAIFAKAKLPVIGSDTALAQYANMKDHPFLFSTGASGTQEADAAAQWIKRSGFTRIAFLSDGIPDDNAAVDSIRSETKRIDPKAKVVTSAFLAPGGPDMTALVAELKAANPQLVIVYLGAGYGLVGQEMQAADWSPTLLVGPGAWYSRLRSVGTLEARAYVLYYGCATSAAKRYSAETTSLMSQYSAATQADSIDYLTYVTSESVPLDLLEYAAKMEHSDSPGAIKAALEGIHDRNFLGAKYDFSASSHFGPAGASGAAVCRMGPPYAGGVGRVPLQSKRA